MARPCAEHRERIDLRHGLAERLSVAARDGDGSLLAAVNRYHREHQGRYSAASCEQFRRIAPLVLAAVRRHLALAPPQPPAAGCPLHG